MRGDDGFMEMDGFGVGISRILGDRGNGFCVGSSSSGSIIGQEVIMSWLQCW